jgi:hypothetical protein
MDFGGRWFGVVAKDAAKLSELRPAQRLVRRLDSALAGRPVWTHLPMASVSREDRQIMDRILTGNSVGRVAARKGVLGRIVRALVWFLPPGSGG